MTDELMLDAMGEALGKAMKQVATDLRREIAALETRLHIVEVQLSSERTIRELAEKTTREIGARDAQLAAISRQLSELNEALGALRAQPQGHSSRAVRVQ